jgi:hypothetical protein
MRRYILHLSFWFVYIVYDILLHYTWMGPTMAGTAEGTQLKMAVSTAFTLLPVKVIFVYFLTRMGIKNVLSDERHRMLGLVEIVLAYGLAVVIFRVLFYFYVYPSIYLQAANVPLLNARSIFIAVLEVGFIGGLAFALKLFRLQAAARERERNLTKEKLETELKFLRNQTNPHFLFNTLNNIYALARKKSDETPEVVMKLSELLSFMLYESSKDTISIDEEIKMMQDYIDLQKIRFSDRLSVRFNRKIDDGSQRIAPLLLLPLVENAFKHGVSESRFNSFIHIDFFVEQGNLDFCIENTMEDGKAKDLNGQLGLKNMKRQLELMYKNHNLQVENNEVTFKVKTMINLNSYGKN